MWFTEEEKPYLLTGEPPSSRAFQIVEADGLQLLEMQKQAFSTLLDGTSIQARKIRDILFNNHRDDGSSITYPISFYEPRVARNQSQKKSVERALAASDKGSFFLVHGPNYKHIPRHPNERHRVPKRRLHRLRLKHKTKKS